MPYFKGFPHYLGDGDTRPQTVRLRAASRRADLRLQRPTIAANGRLRASGSVSSSARGVVRVQIEYVVDGKTTTLQFLAPISGGRWSLNQALSQTVRKGDRAAQRDGAFLHAVHRIPAAARTRRDALLPGPRRALSTTPG